MNLDPHWLKERYKDKSDQLLHIDSLFAKTDAEVQQIYAELKRRERETHETNG